MSIIINETTIKHKYIELLDEHFKNLRAQSTALYFLTDNIALEKYIEAYELISEMLETFAYKNARGINFNRLINYNSVTSLSNQLTPSYEWITVTKEDLNAYDNKFKTIADLAYALNKLQDFDFIEDFKIYASTDKQLICNFRLKDFKTSMFDRFANNIIAISALVS